VAMDNNNKERSQDWLEYILIMILVFIVTFVVLTLLSDVIGEIIQDFIGWLIHGNH
jgi:hypothetical protein